MACVTSCELTDLLTSTACNNKGGLKKAYWTLGSNIDWDAMEADAASATPVLFDPVEQKYLGFAMIGGAVFNKVEFKRKESSYSLTYSADTSLYEAEVSFTFEGKGNDIRKALCAAIACCDLILVVEDSNCEIRVFGKDWDGQSFTSAIESFRITGHVDSSGTFGGDKPIDELTLGGELECTPPYAAFDKNTFEANYV